MTGSYFSLNADGRRLECRWFGERSGSAPSIVFLHEGLGCIEMWKDFPERIARVTGLRAFCYSRCGYGRSERAKLPRTTDYMHHEALVVLPEVLTAAGIDNAILLGHSDGASIALIHAGGVTNAKVRGLVLLAPHVFSEQRSIAGIQRAAHAYRKTDLRERLARYHGPQVDQMFWGWYDVWQHNEFARWNIEEYVPNIEMPVLLIQGADDEYGSERQLESIENKVYGPVRKLVLPDCGHAPHIEQQAEVVNTVSDFITEWL